MLDDALKVCLGYLLAIGTAVMLQLDLQGDGDEACNRSVFAQVILSGRAFQSFG